MSIVCGTDFSLNDRQASEVAAALAARMGWPLALVHVVEEYRLDALLEPARATRAESLARRLEHDAHGLAARYGARVEPVAVPGVVYEKLPELAREHRAPFVIVASLSAPEQRWAVGSVAERVAQCSPVPVLVIREAERLLAWLRGERALRVMVGVGGGASSRAALDFAASLRGFGPVDLLLTEIVWPMSEYSRYGLAPPVPIDRLRPEQEALLVRDLTAWAGDVAGEGSLEVVEDDVASLGICRAATRLDADAICLGTHGRKGISLLVLGSVAADVLARAEQIVVLVPGDAHAKA